MTSRTFDPLRQELAAKQDRLAPVFEREMTRRLREAAPKVTGRMAAATSVRLTTSTSSIRMADRLHWEAKVDVEYASWVHDGTRPHTIVPVNASVLAFFWERVGRFVFFMKVNHPGNAPNPWFRRTLDSTSDLLSSLWRRF